MSLKVERLSFSYQAVGPWGKKILNDITFTLSPGEILGISGTPGSGKSTLLQILNGLLPIDKNQVIIDGQDIGEIKGDQLKLLRQKVGLVAQFPEKQLFARTVFEDVAFGPTNWGLKKPELDNRVKEAMEMVGLDFETFKDRRPLGLSGGEKRKVALAGILSIKPQYLLLDEPTAGMDHEARQKLFSALLKLKEQMNIGIIIVSHRPQDLLETADQILILENGRIAACGETFKIIETLEQKSGEIKAITPARELIYQLRANGLPVDKRVKNPEQAAKNIVKALKGEITDAQG